MDSTHVQTSVQSVWPLTGLRPGVYPDNWRYYVDLSDFPAKHRGASLDASSQLTKRGLMVNSIEWEVQYVPA